MNALYFKHKVKYCNGTEAKNHTYIRILESGKVTVISLNKRTVSNPKSLSISQNGLEPATKVDFDTAYNEIINN